MPEDKIEDLIRPLADALAYIEALKSRFRAITCTATIETNPLRTRPARFKMQLDGRDWMAMARNGHRVEPGTGLVPPGLYGSGPAKYSRGTESIHCLGVLYFQPPAATHGSIVAEVEITTCVQETVYRRGTSEIIPNPVYPEFLAGYIEQEQARLLGVTCSQRGL